MPPPTRPPAALTACCSHSWLQPTEQPPNSRVDLYTTILSKALSTMAADRNTVGGLKGGWAGLTWPPSCVP